MCSGTYSTMQILNQGTVPALPKTVALFQVLSLWIKSLLHIFILKMKSSLKKEGKNNHYCFAVVELFALQSS